MLDLTRYDGHTPGPWRWHGLESRAEIVSLNNAYHDDILKISDAWFDNPPDKKDAVLLADAPELLAELKRLRRLLLTINKVLLFDTVYIPDYKDLDKAEALITAALEEK